jgi:predicted RNA-binding Zn ribbon-like protein
LMNRLAPPRAGIVWRRGTADWITAETSPMDAVLWPIVWSAEDLLVSGERGRLKTCGSEACGWLFYDESRSRRRRWCSMSDCGNRAKAKRFYHRGRSG